MTDENRKPDDVVEGFVHFHGVLDGHEGLFAEGGGAAVPEEGIFPGEVEEGHGVALARLAVDAEAELAAVGEGMGDLVAGGAGDGVVAGEDGVVEE